MAASTHPTARSGARVAIGAGAALLAACLAGAPLLVSASASGAVQLQLEQECPSAVALSLPIDDRAHEAFLDEQVDRLVGVQPPRVTTMAQRVSIGGLADGIAGPAVLVNVDGQDTEVSPPLPSLAANDVALSQASLDRLGLEVGDQVTLEQESTATVRVAAVFDDLPYEPANDFWCGRLEPLFSPTASGDPPRQIMVVAAPELLESFEWFGFWETRLIDEPITRRRADDIQERFTEVTAAYADFREVDVRALRENAEPDPVATVVSRAESLASAVQTSIAPVRIVGVLTALLVLAAAAVMLARERRRELRLLALRGLPPWQAGLRLTRAAWVPVAIGALVGFGLAIVGIRTLGPTPELEPDRVVVAGAAVVLGAAVAVLIVVCVASVVGDRFVDPAARRRWWHRLPLELPLVIATLASFRALDQSGGMRMFGVEARGGALLAQAFPQLAIATGVALLARPTTALLRRCRVVGHRLSPGLRLGVRRIVIEPAVTTTMMLAVALASGSFVLAGILSSSAQRQLHDKASLFIGSDLAINLNGTAPVPHGLVGQATSVGRTAVSTDDPSVSDPVEVLAIDLDTFADAVTWRDDASDASLDELLDLLRWQPGDTRVPAVAVADDLPAMGAELRVTSGADDRPIDLTVNAVADFFPGYRQGSTLFVVDRTAVEAAEVPLAHTMWVHDPPDDAAEQVRSVGGRVRSTLAVGDVFDVVSYSAQRWSYVALGAFGILVACTVVTLQLLVVEARRDTRRLSHLMMCRMGFRTRSLWVASTVEVGVPLAVGAAAGAGLARLAAAVSVRRLDPLPRLRPPSVVVTPMTSLVTAGIAVVVASALLAVITVWSVRRGDPMEVSRGTA